MNNEYMITEDLLILGDSTEEVKRTYEYIQKKVGKENVAFIDRDFMEDCERMDDEIVNNRMFIKIRTTLETFNELKFQLDLTHHWVC